MQPVREWDPVFVETELVNQKESSTLEFKASDTFNPAKNSSKQDIAKEICAFANAGGGVLAIGISNEGNGIDRIDPGVPLTVGNQAVESWLESSIPMWLHPPLTQFTVNVVQTCRNVAGKGVVAIEIPVSDLRPHWNKIEGDKAYIRAGEHSLPMHPQTLLEISSRGVAPRVEIIKPVLTWQQPHVEDNRIDMSATIQVASGPLCRRWLVEIESLDRERLRIEPAAGNLERSLGNGLTVFTGYEPLYPMRPTNVSKQQEIRCVSLKRPFRDCTFKSSKFRISVYAESARPVSNEWALGDVFKSW